MPLRVTALSCLRHGAVSRLHPDGLQSHFAGDWRMSNRDFIAYGTLHSADFEEKTLTFKIEGDMPVVMRGRFAMVGFDKFSSAVRMARLWAETQQEKG
jgi:hypothetical protein